jgi:hypothetical protein
MRLHKLFDKTIELATDHHTGNYPGAVVNSAGDVVSGGLHPELLKTHEEEALPAANLAIDWIITASRSPLPSAHSRPEHMRRLVSASCLNAN